MTEKELIIQIKKELQKEDAEHEKRKKLEEKLSEKEEEIKKIRDELYNSPSQSMRVLPSNELIHNLLDLWRGGNGS
jgi:hypothetical protein